jgi:methionyl-tRNA synthetase
MRIERKMDMAKDKIKLDDLDKVEFKLGVILQCELHPDAERLLVFQVDVGEEEPRQIVSSIAEFYKPEEVIGKRVVVVTNLKKAKFRGVESNGMLLCASLPQDEDVELLTITKDFPGGTLVE